jgi:ribosome-binding factor A
MTRRTEKMDSLLRDLISDYFTRSRPAGVFITISRVETSENIQNADVFVTIFPENKEKETLKNILRERGSIRKYIGPKLKTRNIPYLNFAIDKGEKARQKINGILNSGEI